MVGGNQLKSRREKLKKMLNDTVLLSVTNEDWGINGKTYSVHGILNYKTPNGGYFLKDTNARIIMSYITSIDLESKTISMNLSNSSIKSALSYMEAQGKWHH